jgi:hypothetical protein
MKPRRKTPAAERFWAKVDASGPCWLWTASLIPFGYGQFGAESGVNVRAHRFAYELLVGPIPEGMQLDHLCRVRHCVNPDHLEPVTHKEHMRRSVRARRNHCKYGHPFDQRNTSVRTDGARACKTCMRDQWRARKERTVAA